MQEQLIRKIIFAFGLILFLIGLNYFWIGKVNISKARNKIEKVIHDKENAALNIFNNKKFLTNYNSPNYLHQLKSEIDEDGFYLFIFDRDELVYWSTNDVLIKSPKVVSRNDKNFIKIDNGYYLAMHKYLPDMLHQAVILIPIYIQYSNTNQFLKSGFAFENNILKRIKITTKYINEKSIIKNLEGEYIFSIKENTSYSQISDFMFFILIALFIYLMYHISQLVKLLLQAGKQKTALLFVLIVVVLIELLFNHTELIIDFPDLELFSSKLYASNFLADNLGVLMIRVLLCIWCLYFLKYIRLPKSNFINNYVLVLVPIIHFYYVIYIIGNIINNSTINFNFFSYTTIDFYSYISILLFGLLFFSLVQMLNFVFVHKKEKISIYIIIIAVCLFTIYQSFQATNIYFECYLGLWLVSFILIFYIKNEIKTKYYFITSILILALLSMLLTTTLWVQSAQTEFEIKKSKVHELFIERDVVEEFELSGKENNIQNDGFISKYLANPYLLNIDLSDRVLRNLGGLNKNYIINIYAYDFDKNPIKGTSDKAAAYFDRILRFRNTAQISNNFYHIPIKETGEKYIGKFEYKNDTIVNGYLYIELIPRVFKINSAYPELLSQNKTYYDEILKNYAYAIYQNKKLIKSDGEFQYSTYFDFPINQSLEFTQEEQSGFNHLIYQNKDKIVVVSEPEKSIWIAVSIFSFIVLNLLFLFILLDLFGFSTDLWVDTKIKDFFVNNTLQKQIQNYTIILLLLSLGILALITFVYFNYQYRNIYKSKIEQNTNIVVKNFKQLFNEYYPIYGEETYVWVMQNRLQQRSDIFETDITAYNTNGDMIATSNPEIYENNLISKKINSDAYYALNTLRKSKFINEESIGKLHFMSLYLAITTDGNTKLYLQFPHYNIDKYLRSEIILFLISLINIYVFSLIVIAFAAVYLSKSATNSLSIISEHIKNVDLNKKNIPLEWNKTDEIGLLVKQYNNMLKELEQSALLLAKSEREGAWSEMAKQVAHEIKNPLTPMKLSIQHLQRALMDNSPDIKTLAEKISERLIEQIDVLSDIASAFSDFAKLPSTKNVQIDFMPILESVIDLFEETEHIHIGFNSNIASPAIILADKNQLTRVFTNILKNAIQSIPKDKEGELEVTVQDKITSYLLSFKDNGEGIPKDKHEKIFEPNFTTKTSGTGLGLAICRNIIDNINGKIWLESVEGNYTIFYIEIPKIIV